MPSVSLSEEMLFYFTQLDDAEKKSVLNLIRTFAGNKLRSTTPQSLEVYNKELEIADKEIAEGEFVLHEDVLKMYGK